MSRGFQSRVSMAAFLVAFGVTASSAVGQTAIHYAPHAGTVELVDLSKPGKYTPSASPTKSVKAGAITFNIEYLDVENTTGVGFDDATEGAARQATVDAVLEYIDAVLNIDVVSTIDIQVQESQTAGDGFLASAGTFYFTSPNGFEGGFAFDHITTGTDPTGAAVDITMTVDFGHPWNSDHTVDPGGGEYDLFSVVLHEFTHGLGITSLSDVNGESGVSDGNPGVFSTWDGLMRLGSGSPAAVFNQSTTVLDQPTSVFTSDNLFFGGAEATSAFGSIPPIYAPGTFESGSSLGHYDSGITGGSVMEPSISNGEIVREYTALDLGTLVDLGYTDVAVPGAATPEPTSAVGGGLFEAGDAIELTAAFDNAPLDAEYQWMRNGNAVSNGGRISGATTTTLTISPADESDDGNYRLRLDDDAKAFFFSDPIYIQVAAEGGLPAAGGLGLGLLGGALAAAAAMRIHRRK